MSTRGLYGYIEEGKYTGQYNHSDSYPSVLGLDFYEACRDNDFTDFQIEQDDISFIKDSLFCEWAYFYDKENKIFEIWKGFQQSPDESNPFGIEINESDYYPCKRLIGSHIDNISDSLFVNNNIEKIISRDKKIDIIINNGTNS